MCGSTRRDVKNTGALSGYTEHIRDSGRRGMVESVIQAFRSTVLATSAHFRHGIIHVREQYFVYFEEKKINRTKERRHLRACLNGGT